MTTPSRPVAPVAANGLLLPCPFCGGEPSKHGSPHDIAGDCHATVYCLYCNAEMPGDPQDSKEEASASAIAAWNRRAPPQAQQEGEV